MSFHYNVRFTPQKRTLRCAALTVAMGQKQKWHNVQIGLRLPNHLDPAGTDMGHAAAPRFRVVVDEPLPTGGKLQRHARANAKPNFD